MGLLSFFKRHDDAPAAAATAPDAVVVARTRARRRLIGATVLLAIGIVGFPLLFETQPRPIPVDIPIEIPRKETAPALSLPPARPASAVVVAPMEPAQDAAAVANPVAVAPRSAVPPTPVPAALPAPGAASAAARVTAVPPEPRTASQAAAKPVAAASRTAQPGRSEDAQRAQALLEGKGERPAKAEDAAASARVVVQVGAYSDNDKLREARQKVEKLGMKTYTQVVESDSGRRTRVRVGPFATRAEAEKAAARIKSTGLPAAILSL